MSPLAEACKRLEITLTAAHHGLADRDGSMVDRWTVTLAFQGRTANFEYFTGIGSRTPGRAYVLRNNRVESARGVPSPVVPLTLEKAAEAGYTVPQAPSPADVVSSVLLDASVFDMTFEEWADDYGFDSDSRKALATYLLCQENASKALKLLTAPVMDELSRLEH